MTMSPSPAIFRDSETLLMDEIIHAAGTVELMVPIVQNYAALGYKGPLANAVKNLAANARQVVLVHNMLVDLAARQEAAQGERSKV